MKASGSPWSRWRTSSSRTPLVASTQSPSTTLTPGLTRQSGKASSPTVNASYLSRCTSTRTARCRPSQARLTAADLSSPSALQSKAEVAALVVAAATSYSLPSLPKRHSKPCAPSTASPGNRAVDTMLLREPRRSTRTRRCSCRASRPTSSPWGRPSVARPWAGPQRVSCGRARRTSRTGTACSCSPRPPIASSRGAPTFSSR
mmetsp:Transcript_1478/g.3712  ORF Transcript_1478/g.3712 Transcript_1478/m.3712 type:complete len:203 (+) Transcript_1478:337-945(+)